MTLISFYSGPAAVILGSLVAVLMMFLFGFADLPAWYRIESNGVGHARWSLCFGFLATSVAMLFWRPQDRVFLDRICIHEKDSTESSSHLKLGWAAEKARFDAHSLGSNLDRADVVLV